MKRTSVLLLLSFMAILALVTTGCGSAENTSTVQRTEPESSSTGNPGSMEPDKTPEEFVSAYLEAIRNDRYEEAEAFWDEKSLDKLQVTTNWLAETVSVESSGSGDTRRVTAEVYYHQCESGEKLKATVHFTLVNTDGKWKITDSDCDLG